MGRPTWELGSYNLIQLATFMIRCYPNSSYVVNIVCSVSGTGKDVGLYAEYARMGVQHEDQSDVGFQIWDNSMYLSSGTEIIGHRPPQEWMVSLKCWANVLVLNVGGVIDHHHWLKQNIMYLTILCSHRVLNTPSLLLENCTYTRRVLPSYRSVWKPM